MRFLDFEIFLLGTAMTLLNKKHRPKAGYRYSLLYDVAEILIRTPGVSSLHFAKTQFLFRFCGLSGAGQRH